MNQNITYLGNKDLLDTQKIAFFAPSQIATLSVLKCYDWAIEMFNGGKCIISGFSSRMEKDVLHFLLKGRQPIILVLSRRMYSVMPQEYIKPLEEGRLLIISTSNETRQSKKNAFRRNCYIAEIVDEIVFPSTPPDNSSLFTIYKMLQEEKKSIRLLHSKE